jgi:CHAD domain-containing protein
MSALLSEPSARVAIALSLAAQLRALREQLDAEHEKPKRGQVHRLRVATRRLLAALELAGAAGVRVPKTAGVRLEKLLDRLSPLRDAQVMERGLLRLPKAQVGESLLRLARRARRKQRVRAGKQLTRFDADALSAELSAVSQALGESAHDSALGELALTGFLAQQQLAIDEQRAHALQASPHDLHRLRLALKAHRYTLEILAGQLPHGALALLELMTSLQDELGSAHDLLVLCELSRKHAKARRSKRSRRLAEELAARSRQAHAQAAERVHGAELPWPLARDGIASDLTHTKSAP